MLGLSIKNRNWLNQKRVRCWKEFQQPESSKPYPNTWKFQNLKRLTLNLILHHQKRLNANLQVVNPKNLKLLLQLYLKILKPKKPEFAAPIVSNNPEPEKVEPPVTVPSPCSKPKGITKAATRKSVLPIPPKI